MGNRASRKSNELVEQINCIKERLEELEQELKGKNDWKDRFEKEKRGKLEILQKGRLYGDHWIERLAEEQKEQKGGLERTEKLEQFVQELKKENYWIERLAKEQKEQKEEKERVEKERQQRLNSQGIYGRNRFVRAKRPKRR